VRVELAYSVISTNPHGGTSKGAWQRDVGQVRRAVRHRALGVSVTAQRERPDFEDKLVTWNFPCPIDLQIFGLCSCRHRFNKTQPQALVLVLESRAAAEGPDSRPS